MEVLLQSVLSGALPWQLALAWAVSSGDAAPPPELKVPGAGMELSPSTTHQPLTYRPVDFRTHVLNHVREQAELILAAAEQEAGPSHPPTPEALSKGLPAPTAGSSGRLDSASHQAQNHNNHHPQQQQQQRRPATPKRQQQQVERQQAQLQRVSRRLEPGVVDDDNFPALGAPAPSRGASPAKPKKAGARRTIVPAKLEPSTAPPPGPGAAAFASAATLPLSPPRVRGAPLQQRAEQSVPPSARMQGRAALDVSSPPAPLVSTAAPEGAKGPSDTAAAAAAGPTPKRRLIPTRVEGSSLQVSESFLVSPAMLPLQRPSLAGNTQGAAGASHTAAAFQLTPVEAQEVCVKLSFGNEGSTVAQPSREGPSRRSRAPPPGFESQPGSYADGDAPGRLGKLMAGMALSDAGGLQSSSSSSSRGADGSKGAWGRQQHHHQQQQQQQCREQQQEGWPSPGRMADASTEGRQPLQPQSSRSASAWPALGQSTPAQQPAVATCGEPGSRGKVARHQQPTTVTPNGISPQLRTRLEAEPGSGSKGSPTGSLLANTAAAEPGQANGTPPTVASLGPGGTPGSTAAPKFPSPMEAVFRRLDARLSKAAGVREGLAAEAVDGTAVSSQALLGLWEGDRAGQGAANPSETTTELAAVPEDLAVPATAAPRRSPLGAIVAAAVPANGAASSAEAGLSPALCCEVSCGPQARNGACSDSPQRKAACLSPQKRAAEAEEEAGPDAMTGTPDQQQPAIPLTEPGARLAHLHAGLLAGCSELALGAELDLLMNLLAVGTGVRVDPQLAHLTVLWCGELAQQYACCVLQSAGGLVRGLGPKLLEDLRGLPIIQAHFPQLQQAMQATLDHFQAIQLHTERAYHQVKSGSILSLFGLPAFTNDGRRSRSQEEQRRLNNRESCRDEWFALMKEAAAQMNSFAGRQLGAGLGDGSLRGLAAGGSDRLSEAGSRAGMPGGDEASVLQAMQHSTTELLRRLRHDNYGAFAELFVAAVLQAAATGERETIMDDELARLAKKNLSKFQQLNQRMQAGQGGPPGPSRGGAARRQHNQPAIVAGFGRQAQHQRPPFHGGGGSKGYAGKGGGTGGEEGLAASLQLLAEFPQPQRLYVMFLEAADSHRLNSSLIRCMAAKLRSLNSHVHLGEGGVATPTALGEKVVATSTLAGFLSYLCFVQNGPGVTGSGEDPSDDDSFDGSHPVDVKAALEAAAEEGSSLVWTVPWVVRYLWFLGWDAEGLARSAYFRSVLGRLQRLRLSVTLMPRHPAFGLAGFCLRSLLDGFAERMGPQLMPAPDAVACGTGCMVDSAPLAWQPESLGAQSSLGHNASLEPTAAGTAEGATDSATHLPPAAISAARAAAAGHSLGQQPATATLLGTALAACDGLLERRYVQLCCPALDYAQQLFRSRAGAAGSAGAASQAPLVQRRIKKIRPTSPSGPAAARVALQVPAALQSAADAGHDVVKLRLQRAFLEQYSTEEHKVKLKEVVDYVADIIAYNAATTALGALAQPAIEAATAQMIDAAEGLAVSLIGQGQLAPSMEPAVRLYMESMAEQLIAAAATQLLQEGQQHAEREIQAHAVRAMLALTPAALGEAVVGTAAAIVAEYAGTACAQRLLSQVPSLVRESITAQIDTIMTAVRRGRLAQLKANNKASPAASAPAALQHLVSEGLPGQPSLENTES